MGIFISNNIFDAHNLILYIQLFWFGENDQFLFFTSVDISVGVPYIAV